MMFVNYKHSAQPFEKRLNIDLEMLDIKPTYIDKRNRCWVLEFNIQLTFYQKTEQVFIIISPQYPFEAPKIVIDQKEIILDNLEMWRPSDDLSSVIIRLKQYLDAQALTREYQDSLDVEQQFYDNFEVEDTDFISEPPSYIELNHKLRQKK